MRRWSCSALLAAASVMVLGTTAIGQRESVPAPDLSGIQMLNGDPFVLEPGRPHVLVFWYVGAPPCVKALERLQAISEVCPDCRTVAVNIYARDTVERVESFMRRRAEFTFEVALDPAGRMSRSLGKWISTVPSYAFIDRQGNVVDGQQGLIGEEQLVEKVAMIAGSGEAYRDDVLGLKEQLRVARDHKDEDAEKMVLGELADMGNALGHYAADRIRLLGTENEGEDAWEYGRAWLMKHGYHGGVVNAIESEAVAPLVRGEGSRELAISRYQELADLDPSARLLLVNAYEKLDQLREFDVSGFGHSLVARYRDDELLMYELGQSIYRRTSSKRRDLDLAAVAAQAAIEASGGDEASKLDLYARILEEQGEWAKAAEMMDRALEAETRESRKKEMNDKLIYYKMKAKL